MSIIEMHVFIPELKTQKTFIIILLLIGLDRVIIPQILDRRTMDELFELRLILEMGIVEILFIRKTAEDIVELRNMLGKEKSSATRAISIKSEVEYHNSTY